MLQLQPNPYCYNVKELAILLQVHPRTATRQVIERKAIKGVRVRYIGGRRKGEPIRIHAESFRALQRAVLF